MSFPKHARHNVLPPTHPNINSQKTTATMSQTHNCRKCHRHRHRRRRHHKCLNQRHRHRHRRHPRRHRHRAKTNSIMNKLNHCLTEQQLPKCRCQESRQNKSSKTTHPNINSQKTERRILRRIVQEACFGAMCCTRVNCRLLGIAGRLDKSHKLRRPILSRDMLLVSI